MRRWRVVLVDDGTEDDLTDSELIGISVALAHVPGPRIEFEGYRSVYLRAWDKLQPAVTRAIDERPTE